MADLFPSEPRSGAPRSERRVFDALGALAPEWTVVHSVAWQASRDGRQGDGEADFCVLHPLHGLGVLEVKGGGVRSDPRAASGWVTIDATGIEHQIKDPFRQATATKHTLLGALRGLDPFLPGRVRLWHAVVLPDVILDGPIGMQPRELVFDARDLARVEDAMLRTTDHWEVTGRSSWAQVELARVRDMLAPALELRRALVSEMDTSISHLVDLTLRQYAVIEAMRHNRRLLVRGGAGTGKSLLALERSRRLAREGRQVLLLCFNAPLAHHLAGAAASDQALTVSTFHAFILGLARRAGVRLPADFDDPEWVTAPSRVLAAVREARPFDAVIVDEGQDFEGAWLAALSDFVGPNATMLVMADPHQQLYTRTFAPPTGWPIAELDQNCRNTLPIARLVALAGGDDVPAEGAPGRDAVVVRVVDNASVWPHVREVVARLIDEERVEPRRLVVLTELRERAQSFIGRAAGSALLDAPGRGGVVVETVHRFKGLESDAVVLVVERAALAEAMDPILYVGMSRARALLVVVAATAARARVARCVPS